MRPLHVVEQQVAAQVAEHGCAVMSISYHGDERPDFSYSVGFERTAGHPEVIVFSLDEPVRHFMINELLRQIEEHGLKLSDGVEVFNLVEGHRCIARAIEDPNAVRDYFGLARWYKHHCGSGEIQRAFQIVWPGAVQGLFPWDDGCPNEVIDLQPALYDERTVH